MLGDMCVMAVDICVGWLRALSNRGILLMAFVNAAAAADKVISCWHEIPLWAGEDELHFICEIPKETSAKMEVATVRRVINIIFYVVESYSRQQCCGL
jgi:hypothetical protein